MELFKVPGWSVPASVSNSQPERRGLKKKRKRRSHEETTQHDNVDGLVKKLRVEGGVGEVDRSKKRKRKISKDGRVSALNAEAAGSAPSGSISPQATSGSSTKVGGNKRTRSRPTSTTSETTDISGLTALQRNFKQNLDGARFRWLNVQLYNTNSTDAHKMMRDDPMLYEEYHVGFRRQVHSWPVNPASHYITKFSGYAPKTVIADLGCGDAALARVLIPKGMAVLSFDLVSDGVFVIEADICQKVPLPGAEDAEEGHVVDVVVCSLSLMPSNWLSCIREAWRILKPGGEFHIAEVASRFTDIESFISLISSVGFRLLSKDESNSHFTLFEWRKISRKTKTEAEWARLSASSSVLKPCEYKRR